ncbi:hypothetical protein J7E87_15110 [Streptomyces sp. ISL-1]|uniref:DUF6349 family protein n=1 Tax=Streptomyces sp. ISL-1 TaxID=2817657 RepID=UPI001BE6706F|nr:DUF6349 family protein [Streptomyces sp. ISL-1]MBT2390719.1 hypothetical protein [Streptomyces sp. ISL-1]
MTTPAEPVGAVARHTAYLPRFWDKTQDVRDVWSIDYGHPGFTLHTPPEPTADHQPTVITRRWNQPAPQHPEETWTYLHRGTCLGCTWEGLDRRRTDEAVEDAHDHTHPKWRTLPPLPERRGRHWLTHAKHLYPEGWFDNGGPVRTIRTGIEKQHRPGGAPGGGYDLAVVPRKRERRMAINETLPLDADSAEAA